LWAKIARRGTEAATTVHKTAYSRINIKHNMKQFLHETCNSLASKQAFITRSSTPRRMYYFTTQKETITSGFFLQRSSITADFTTTTGSITTTGSMITAGSRRRRTTTSQRGRFPPSLQDLYV
jgi:hypothetical protein